MPVEYPVLIRAFGSQRRALVGVSVAGAVVAHLLTTLTASRVKKAARRAPKANTGRVDGRAKRPFLTVLMRVLKHGMRKTELFNLLGLTGSLMARTWLSVWISKHLGTTIGFFCDKDWHGMSDSIKRFAQVSILASLVNSALKLFVDLFEENLRARLTRLAHRELMKDLNFYLVNKVGTDRLENSDQLIAEDIAKFSASAAFVYTQSLKPVVDFAMFTWQLREMLGIEGPLVLFSWFYVAGAVSRLVSPRFGKIAQQQQVLEGRFRARHAALINNSEMVAFLGGEKPEAELLAHSFDEIRGHKLGTLGHKFGSDLVQSYLNKYLATVVGFCLTVRPVLVNTNGMATASAGQIAAFFVSTRGALEGLASSVLAIFELQKRVGDLSGLSRRVDHLLTQLSIKNRVPVLATEIQAAEEAGNGPRRTEGELLVFKGLDVFRPDGMLLLKNLNAEIPRGVRVIVSGENGCGKSSLFRVINKLWPQVSGQIIAPPPKDCFFLSQVNFVPIGRLRDLITYPDKVDPPSAELDTELRLMLAWADLADLNIDGRQPALDDVLEWDTSLSPGQKQRVAFARMFFHRPKFAVIDEASNGVAPDVERALYDRCRTLNMAVFSISHKVELKALHDYELHYTGKNGGWSWIDLATNDVLYSSDSKPNMGREMSLTNISEMRRVESENELRRDEIGN